MYIIASYFGLQLFSLSHKHPHLNRIVLNPPEINPLGVGNHQPHNASSLGRFQLPCFKFVLLPFLRSCTDCRQLRYAGNDAPEHLSVKPSLYVTIPGVVVVGVQFVKTRN